MSKKEPNLYKRGEIWYVKIERKGARIHESTGEQTLAAAREYRERAFSKLKALRNGTREDITYDKAMEQFLDHCDAVLKPGAVKRYEVSARALHPHFTGKKLADISKAHIVTYLSDRKREVSGSGVNRDRACLSAMMSFALDRDYIAFNPVFQVKKMREAEPRTRNFTPKEFDLIMKECGQLLADMCKFDVHTGLRSDELINLTWKQINFAEHQLTLLETKSGKRRIVPLNDRALEILSSQIRHIKSGLVFHHSDGKPYKNANRAFGEAANRAADKLEAKAKTPEQRQEAQLLRDAQFHDLRRTFTCWNYNKGVPLHILSKLLGHSGYTITEKHYAFLQTEGLHQALRGVANSSQAQGIPGVNLSRKSKERKAK